MKYISPNEISLKYALLVLSFRAICLEEEKQEKDAKQQVPNPKNYTIFHAIVETLEKKEKGESSRRRFLRKLRLNNC